MSKLTKAQRQRLREICNHGERVYNGRALRPLERLHELGLINADFDMLPQGNGLELRWRIAASPTPKGLEWDRRQPT